jgi:predicted heme/steroid binding protein
MKGTPMKKTTAAISVFVLVLALTSLSLAFQASKGGDADAVAAITKYENDVVKADLANDGSLYEKNLADDWTGGTSRGTWDTKASILADMKDTKNNKTNSESISELKVRVHGDVAIATYKSTYDATIKGQHYARTVLTTDTFQRQNGAWKVMASHSSQAAK